MDIKTRIIQHMQHGGQWSVLRLAMALPAYRPADIDKALIELRREGLVFTAHVRLRENNFQKMLWGLTLEGKEKVF